MALRLRRGTDAERQLITPVEGELIYVTDTKELYAGDGNTVGGVRVTGEIADTINGLADVDAGVPQDNDILLYSDITAKWESSPLSLRTLPDVEADAILDGQILAWNAGISAFVPANNVGGGDTTFDGDLVGSVFTDDSSLVIDGLTGFIYGTHFGSVNNSITGVEIIDAINNVLKGELVGNVNGNLRGDVAGSVFGDDSSILVDAVNSKIVGDVDSNSVTAQSGGIRVNNIDNNTDASTVIIDYISSPGQDISSTLLGRIQFQANGQGTHTIQNRISNTFFTQSDSGVTGITMYETYSVHGGMKLRVDPSNTQFDEPDSALDIEGVMKLAVQSSAPSTPVEGMITVADGNAAGFDPKGTDSGVSYPVYYDGSGWNALY